MPDEVLGRDKMAPIAAAAAWLAASDGTFVADDSLRRAPNPKIRVHELGFGRLRDMHRLFPAISERAGGVREVNADGGAFGGSALDAYGSTGVSGESANLGKTQAGPPDPLFRREERLERVL